MTAPTSTMEIANNITSNCDGSIDSDIYLIMNNRTGDSNDSTSESIERTVTAQAGNRSSSSAECLSDDSKEIFLPIVVK